MGKFYDSIPEDLMDWVREQKCFWVASAPLRGKHINVSPKGLTGSTFTLVSPNRVWYEDLTGSGNETISHLNEKGNGRITVLFNAFEGGPRIVRLFGQGKAYERGSKEYEELMQGRKRTDGSRAIIMIDVYKVGTSCGFSVPELEYKQDRTVLLKWAARKEDRDVKGEEGGLKEYWSEFNVSSLDGLVGMKDPRNVSKGYKLNLAVQLGRLNDSTLLTGFLAGVVSTLFMLYLGSLRDAVA